MVAGLGLVLVWMLLGWPLCLLTGESTLYLLLGVPLTLLFQRFVRKRPMRELLGEIGGVDAPPPPSGRGTLAIAAALAVVPLAGLVYAALRLAPLAFLSCLIACVGAVPAARAIRRVPSGAAQPLLRHAAIAAAVGLGLLGCIWLVHRPRLDQGVLRAAAVCALSFCTYVPTLFVVEEPFFRGAFDAHADRTRRAVATERAPGGWGSALFVACLWALWNLPTMRVRSMSPASIAVLFATHVAFGLALSMARRQSGRLLAPVLAHALVDAARNALGVGP